MNESLVASLHSAPIRFYGIKDRLTWIDRNSKIVKFVKNDKNKSVAVVHHATHTHCTTQNVTPMGFLHFPKRKNCTLHNLREWNLSDFGGPLNVFNAETFFENGTTRSCFIFTWCELNRYPRGTKEYPDQDEEKRRRMATCIQISLPIQRCSC